jgi:hypothetical protein
MPVKLVVLCPLPKDVEAFETVYNRDHVPMAGEKLAGKTKMVAAKVLGSPQGTPAFHRIAEIHFPSMDALRLGDWAGVHSLCVTKFEAGQEPSAPAGVFYTPAHVAELLQISPKSVIGRFAGMAGVLVLPAENSRLTKRERYRTITIPKHVLDRFIETNTNQASTTVSILRNRRKVRTR